MSRGEGRPTTGAARSPSCSSTATTRTRPATARSPRARPRPGGRRRRRVPAASACLPDALVGDFDSLAPAIAERLEAAGVDFVRHPTRKDVTDGELAVDEALRRGAGEILLAGAPGALDHTLGHLAILRRLAARGVPARLVAPGLSVPVLIAPVSVRLAPARCLRVSLVPLGAGLDGHPHGPRLSADRGVLPADACLGIGNHVATEAPRIVVPRRERVAVLVESGRESFGGAPVPRPEARGPAMRRTGGGAARRA